MISINSIILSILVSVLFRKLKEFPHVIIPTVILTVVCLVTIVFAALATRPNIPRGTFTLADIDNKKRLIFYFFGSVLGTKYKYLRISYTVFMFGFVISVISFTVAELFFKEPLF